MNVITNPSSLNIPATIGMDVADVDTPSLMVDLDAMEYNVAVMAKFIADNNIRLRAHAKCHKSYDIAKIQFDAGAIGVCCQKVSEAESLVNAGCDDVLVSNQVVAPQKIERLARLAKRARMLVCVDDAGNVEDLSTAATRHGVTLECLVEIDVGAGRCGVAHGAPVVTLAKAIDAAPGLKFG
ncbi:MAG: alanine racemase, partial [Paracoccaceae bacterium]